MEILGRHRPDCPGESCTLRADVDGAALCELRGWTVGTVLEGDEGFGPTRIEIRYIGDEILVCRREVAPHVWSVESSWTLTCRCWGKVQP